MYYKFESIKLFSLKNMIKNCKLLFFTHLSLMIFDHKLSLSMRILHHGLAIEALLTSSFCYFHIKIKWVAH